MAATFRRNIKLITKIKTMAKIKFRFDLGLEAEDKITGMKGILTGRAEHIFGCNTYGLSPRTLIDGKRPETEWFDEGRLLIIGKGIDAEEVKADKPGCDYREHP